ncbi:MAG: hypothetical protein ACHP84_03150 [Caulobacterales bacterium]
MESRWIDRGRRVRHQTDLGCWETFTRAAHPTLGAAMLGYLGFRGTLSLARELHLPSGLPAIVVNLGAPFRVLEDSAGIAASSSHPDISFLGIRDRPLAAERLPAAMQIVARPFDEASLFRVGAAYENARGPLAPPSP